MNPIIYGTLLSSAILLLLMTLIAGIICWRQTAVSPTGELEPADERKHKILRILLWGGIAAVLVGEFINEWLTYSQWS